MNIKQKEIFFANLTRIIVLVYVTIGGGQQIYFALTKHHVESSFLFAFLSGSIFFGRIGYGYYSGANKTIPTDIYGLLVIWSVAALRLYYDGW